MDDMDDTSAERKRVYVLELELDIDTMFVGGQVLRSCIEMVA
jgi:hypothetical protein